MDTEETFFLALKTHRESNGIELDEISEFTKINPKYLTAIEEGDFHIIPNIYMRLFIRSYCKYIGADYMQALADYELYTTGKIEPKFSDTDENDNLNKHNETDKQTHNIGDNSQINYKQVVTVILTILIIYLGFKLVEFISQDEALNETRVKDKEQELNLNNSMNNDNINTLDDVIEFSLLTSQNFNNNNLVSQRTEIIPINTSIANLTVKTLQKTKLNFSTLQKNGDVFF